MRSTASRPNGQNMKVPITKQALEPPGQSHEEAAQDEPDQIADQSQHGSFALESESALILERFAQGRRRRTQPVVATDGRPDIG